MHKEGNAEREGFLMCRSQAQNGERYEDSQTLDAQQSSLSAAGAEKVFAEKVSGAVTDRKALAKAS